MQLKKQMINNLVHINAVCSSHKYKLCVYVSIQPMEEEKIIRQQTKFEIKKKKCVNINLSHNVNKVPHFME